MNGLYGYSCPACGGLHATNADMAVRFNEDALAEALQVIYDGMDVRDKIEGHIFRETLRLFNEATAEGLSMTGGATHNELFYQQLRSNNEVFSAFRTHRMQNDVAAQLLDENGKLKPFDTWVRDIQGITDHYVRNWLKTEYDTAIIRAHQAAEWQQFEQEADVFPNVRWMPTTSIQPDPLHRVYWEQRLTLPIDHPFWERHHPGDRWNCKCTLEQTDSPVNDTAIRSSRPTPPQPGLDNNPARDGKLFSSTHPYYTEAYPGARKAADRLLNAQNAVRIRRKEIQKQAEFLKNERLDNPGFPQEIQVTGKAVKEWLNQPHRHYAEKNELLPGIRNVIRDAVYRGWTPYHKGNPMYVRSHIFETEVLGDKSWIIVREDIHGNMVLHSISDSPKVLDGIRK